MMHVIIILAIARATCADPCLDIAGVYTPIPSAQDVILSQDGCSGLSSGGWSYTVDGDDATIDNGVVGTVVKLGDGGATISWSNGITYTKECIDIAGVYMSSAAADVTLKQSLCQGSSSGGWTYTMDGEQATIDNGVTGAVVKDGNGGATISWSNGITYTKACVDIAGVYMSSVAADVTLKQSQCQGHSSGGWSFTVAGNKATIENGITGTILQAGSYATIKWSNGIEYTQGADSSTLAWMSKNLSNLNGFVIATFLMVLVGSTVTTVMAIHRWKTQQVPSVNKEPLLA